MGDRPQVSISRWRSLALAAAGLAFVLMITALYVSIRQTRITADDRLHDAERWAERANDDLAQMVVGSDVSEARVREVVNDVLSHAPADMIRAKWEAWPREGPGSAGRYPEIVVDEQFLHDQVARIRFMTIAYATLSVMAVVILLVVLWGMLAAARREEQLSELKSRFVANVSHELKTPLAMIKMFSETLQEGRVASPEKAKEYHTIISRESTRLSHLIHNMLDFSRIDAGRKQYTMEEIDVGPIVEEAFATHRPELEQLGFEHELSLAEDLPLVVGDAEAIQQVIHNLIGNAVKYSEDDRYVGIEAVRETRRGRVGVLITVKDRGIGIKPAERARLFEGFYRGGGDEVKRRHGTGLGLALVKHIVDAHGGAIDVETRLVKGSAFHVFLPGAKARRDV